MAPPTPPVFTDPHPGILMQRSGETRYVLVPLSHLTRSNTSIPYEVHDMPRTLHTLHVVRLVPQAAYPSGG